MFGGDGIVTAFPDGAIATAVGIDADRRIVAVGYTTGRHVDVVIARFKPDGTPDSSFGRTGIDATTSAAPTTPSTRP